MIIGAFRLSAPALALTLGLAAMPACSSSSSGDGADEGNDAGVSVECPDQACSDAGPGPGSGPDAAGIDAEVPLDCGQGFPSPCAVGGRCKSSADCESTCEGGVCAAPSDTDGKKNDGETDVDCGGPNAAKCGAGKDCVVGPDCGLGYCLSAKCAAPSPTDAVLDGTETDIDCGGAAQTFDGVTVPAAPKCALAKTCAADVDCASAICAESKRCVEALSCRPVHGGYTCGPGEVAAGHESCCKSLPVAGLTMMQGGVAKQVYLDKYEITAGRIREWVKAIKAEYAGVPNVQQWVKTRMMSDPILAAMFPTTTANDLPSKSTGQNKSFPLAAGGTTTLDLGLEDQLGPTSYYRGVQTGGTSGCGMYPGAYGHRTYWYDTTQSQYFGEIDRGAAAKDVLDEKSMNCVSPMIFAAFCAWDGGYMPSREAIFAAWGPKAWPWGDTPTPKDEVAKIANYNAGTSGFGAVKVPRYLFPVVAYDTFANDFTPIIAAPGRFPGDIASQARPAEESWMDLGGNMIEWSQTAGKWYGWTGSSFEGHFYGRAGTSAVYYLDKYGKGGARCMRLE